VLVAVHVPLSHKQQSIAITFGSSRVIASDDRGDILARSDRSPMLHRRIVMAPS